MANRRKFIAGASVFFAFGLRTAAAQQAAELVRIGILGNLSRTEAQGADLWGAFVQGLRELGYVEGQNLEIEERSSEGRYERLPVLAVELVRLKVDVIVVPADQNARAAQQATRTIPIVAASLDEARRADELNDVFAALTAQRAGALLVLADGMFLLHRARIADLATKHRVPAMYGLREHVDAGGLVFYGASLRDSFRRAAIYVDKIIKGAHPGDLPVEQPTKFEPVLNRKTAKALGLTIPPSLLARVDEAIE